MALLGANLGKVTGKSRESHGEVTGKSRESHGNVTGKSRGNCETFSSTNGKLGRLRTPQHQEMQKLYRKIGKNSEIDPNQDELSKSVEISRKRQECLFRSMATQWAAATPVLPYWASSLDGGAISGARACSSARSPAKPTT